MNKISLIFGHAINDIENVYISNKVMPSYSRWKDMLRRVYSQEHISKHPTYIECTVCDEWLLFSNFKIWFDEHYREGFHLDKDILIEDNKIYSPETCVFVPQYINAILSHNKSIDNGLPIGVSKRSYINKKGNIRITYKADVGKLTKTFDSIEEAKQWYSSNKIKLVRDIALNAFMAGEIKTDAYLALIRRKF